MHTHRGRRKGKFKIPTLGGHQTLNVINLPGLVRLVARSDKPEAKAFQRWIFHDVIPSIYKTGLYEARPDISPEIENPAQAKHFPIPDKGIWTIIVGEDKSFRIHREQFDFITHQFRLHESAALGFSIKLIESIFEQHQLEVQTRSEQLTGTEHKLRNAINAAVHLAKDHIQIP